MLRNLTGCLAAILMVSFASGQVTAIKAGRLVDPTTGTVQVNMIILVEGAKIKAIGQDLKIPKEALLIDLSNKTVLPGLIDSHTHLCNKFDAKGDVGAALLLYSLSVSTADRAMHGAANARAMLESGFTCARDMGNAGNYADVALRRAIKEGAVPGPKLFVSGKIIAPFGGQFFLDPEFPEIGTQDYIYADTRDELLKGIRQNIHFGSDWIKIVVDDYRYIYSVEDIRFVVEESAKAGLRVAAHCVTEKGARNAAEAGLASIEHGFDMSNEDLELAKKKGVVLVATELTPQIMDEYRFFTQTHAGIIDRLKRAYRIGVPLVFGSDIIATIPGHTWGTASLSSLDTWIEAGIPPPDILRAITINGARLLGIDKERGVIKEGMAADIIATTENPLENIRSLQHVQFVMKDGRVFKPAQ
jgi:imidazolonepropionase-like amidohydrolase